MLRPEKAGPNTAADHITTLDAAPAQLPAARRDRGAADETVPSTGCSSHPRRDLGLERPAKDTICPTRASARTRSGSHHTALAQELLAWCARLARSTTARAHEPKQVRLQIPSPRRPETGAPAQWLSR